MLFQIFVLIYIKIYYILEDTVLYIKKKPKKLYLIHFLYQKLRNIIILKKTIKMYSLNISY